MEEKNDELVTFEDNNNLPAEVKDENSDGLGFGAGVVIGGGLALAAIGAFRLFKKLKANRTKKEPQNENIIDGEGVEVTKEEEQKKEEPKKENNNRKK